MEQFKIYSDFKANKDSSKMLTKKINILEWLNRELNCKYKVLIDKIKFKISSMKDFFQMYQRKIRLK
jgi:hypothetical protein